MRPGSRLETAYLLAGTGDDKTNIVVYAGLYNQASIQNADTNISHDANHDAWNVFDDRSSNLPGRINGASTRYFKGVFPPLFGASPHLLTPPPPSSSTHFPHTPYPPPV